MELNLTQKDYHKYLTILQILTNLTKPSIQPFNVLRNRELEVFAILLFLYNNKYAELDPEQRNMLIFSYKTRVEIGRMLDNISLDSVYNIMMNLRKHSLITKDCINPQYILPNSDFFKINFVDK